MNPLPVTATCGVAFSSSLIWRYCCVTSFPPALMRMTATPWSVGATIESPMLIARSQW